VPVLRASQLQVQGFRCFSKTPFRELGVNSYRSINFLSLLPMTTVGRFTGMYYSVLLRKLIPTVALRLRSGTKIFHRHIYSSP
jgi:hypothetical protein